MGEEFSPGAFRLFRLSLGVSQTAMARALGCTSESVRSWERGHSTPAGQFVDGIHRLCREEGIDPPTLYQTTTDNTVYGDQE